MPLDSATGAPVEPRDLLLGLGPVVAGLAVGAATGSGGSRWYRRLAKPAWTPPGAAFGPVWTVLYLLMGAAAVLVARTPAAGGGGSGSRPALALWGGQLLLNLAWSVVFFGARRVRLAGAELALLWVAIVATIVAFLRVRVLAGLLLLPYLAWTTFAGLLNAELARRNPDA
jgi:tryptophan-rich sensory protein